MRPPHLHRVAQRLSGVAGRPVGALASFVPKQPGAWSQRTEVPRSLGGYGVPIQPCPTCTCTCSIHAPSL